jgi:hypothetical protein
MGEQPEQQRRLIIGVIGDGRLEPGRDDAKIRISRRLGERLVDAGYRVACGGRAGVMEQVCRGAHDSDAYRDGDTIGILPGGDADGANRFVDVVLPTSLGHARNSVVAQCDAMVAIGGGAGTLSEMCFAWIHNRLIVGVDVDGWSGRLAGERVDGRARFPHIDDDRVWAAASAADVLSILETQLPRYRTGRG